MGAAAPVQMFVRGNRTCGKTQNWRNVAVDAGRVIASKTGVFIRFTNRYGACFPLNKGRGFGLGPRHNSLGGTEIVRILRNRGGNFKA